MTTGFFTNKKVLIIGGTGTIGQSLLRHIIQDNPSVIRLLSRDEYKQFELQRIWQGYKNIRFLIGDIREQDRVIRAVEDIDYVFHVAAMKHVPACEYNPFEAVKTNIIGTQNVIQACLHEKVKKVVFTSTDKAISPTNTYGASKLMAERLVASAEFHKGPRETTFSVVRFGNVMGSRGSVIPLFKSQIESGQEVTVTHMEMSRFMMTIQQATSLTVEAMKNARGGEIFVLKMPVILLKDLVSTVIEEISNKLNTDPFAIGVKEIGLRPGEKMFEELMTYDESMDAIELPEMFVIPNKVMGENWSYLDGKPAMHKSYSSHEVSPISKEEIAKMLLENNLI
jgi:UDP-N-acetylglucosamine 4,6-dehydratase/5-epimerase